MPSSNLSRGRVLASRPAIARRWGAAGVAIMLVIALAAPHSALGAEPSVYRPPSGRPRPPIRTLHINPACNHPYEGQQQIADDLMANRYTFEHEPTVILPPPEEWTWADWTGDVVSRRNWRFQFQALVWVLPLVDAWEDTGEERYRDRALFVVRSWIEHNPVGSPSSTWTWDKHGTSLRAMALVCVARAFPDEDWLDATLVLHGQTLRDPAFYIGSRNGAVNQSIGLLELGCLFDRPNWQRVAENRLTDLITVSIDRQGVANEQSVWYQLYNYERYSIARDRLAACGRFVSPEFAKVDRMPRFLAFATAPDGRYVQIGDTFDRAAKPIPGTVAEFAATLGDRGPKPSSTIVTFDAGYVFGRTGWGESRRYRDEVSFSLRFGPPKYSHGHFDASSLTLYGYGSRLLLDPGYYGSEDGPWRPWFGSPIAHNLVATDTNARRNGDSSLLRGRRDLYGYEALVENRQLADVTSTRRVVFSRVGGYLLVEDRVASSVSRDWAQLWHLREGTRPVVNGPRTWTRRRERGNVLIQQLIAGGTTRIVRGKEKPRQGWLSYQYAEVTPAPTVEYHLNGTSARFLTLIVPFPNGNPQVLVRDLVVTEDGFELMINVRGVKERVVATADGTTITPVE
jgi:hypothetical protein